MSNFLEPLESRKRQRSALADTRRSLIVRRDTLKRALADHRNFDPKACAAEISHLHLTKNQVAESLAQVEETLRAQSVQIRELASKRVSPIKIVSYFSAEQKQLRSKIVALESRTSETQKNKIRFERDLNSTIKMLEENTQNLNNHQNFNQEESKQQLEHINKRIIDVSSDIDNLDSEISGIIRKVGSLLQEQEEFQKRVLVLKSTISEAYTLDDDLSSANNGYERAQIHADCEARFGHGSPKKVRNDASRELRSIENNLRKLERRIKDELKKCEMVVSHIIIDGNNACYDRSQFIRMHALTHLVDELAKQYKVTVVFDASIRSLMKMDDAGIERIIGRSASVHVTPTRTAADEYILRLAQSQPDAYVISNDRFYEFSDYDAVKSGRLLRFMIANNQIMLNDLDISIPFRTSA